MHYPAIKASEYEIEDASLWKLRCVGEITKMTQTHMHFANRCPATFLILPSLSYFVILLMLMWLGSYWVYVKFSNFSILFHMPTIMNLSEIHNNKANENWK